MKRVMHLLMMILGCCIITTSIASADQPPVGFNGFGVPCALASPPSEGRDYLLNQSAYGYLQGFMDVTVNVPAGNCTDGKPVIALCLYNDLKNPTCDLTIFNVGDSHSISSISTNDALTSDVSMQNIILTANIAGTDILCLNMNTPYGVTPLVCKNIVLPAGAPAPQIQQPPGCKPASNACFGINASQSLFNFSGSAVECVMDVMDTIFIDSSRCPTNQESYMSSLKSWGAFQAALQQSITALLILYIMMYGFNVIMNQDKFSLESVVSHIMKFMLVTYFSIGLGPLYFDSSGNKTIHNGMIDWGLPILREATIDFTQMVFTAAGNRDLCHFDIDTYPAGKKAYAVWDVIDCKIGAYFGVKSIYHIGNFKGFKEVGTSGGVGTSPLSTMFVPKPNATDGEAALFSLLALMMLAGNVVLMILLIIFLVIFFSIVLGFLSTYIICIITLHVLVYVSPIFVPLALFERTKNYFDSWLKALVGCTLQPMIIGGFVALMMTMYDDVLFGTDPGCQFMVHELQATFQNANGVAYQNYNSFEMRLPGGGDVSSCTKSLGYKVVAYILGVGHKSLDLFLFSIPYLSDTLDALSSSLILMVFSILFYYFSLALYDFASDITGGIGVGDVAFKMGNMVDEAAKLLKAAANGAKGLAEAAAKGKEPSGGKRDGGAQGGDSAVPTVPKIPGK